MNPKVVYEVVPVSAPGEAPKWALRRYDGGFLPRTERRDGLDIIVGPFQQFETLADLAAWCRVNLQHCAIVWPPQMMFP